MNLGVVGLPGAGKTTLCSVLAAQTGWYHFALGDALRRYAQSDEQTRRQLAEGELAPEVLVERLVRELANRTNDRVLLDGFPRHAEQFDLAKELFGPIAILLVDVDERTATSRLLLRGSTGTARVEDSMGAMEHRLQLARRALSEIEQTTIKLIRVSGMHSKEEVAENAMAALREAGIV